MSRELVQAIYDPFRDLPVNSGFYRQALSEIKHFGIATQIYYLLKKTGQLEKTPYFFQNQLEDTYKEVLSRNLFIKNMIEELLDVFEHNRIEVLSMPLKGTDFAEKYFKNTGASPVSHIGLLVKKKDLSNTIELVKSLGYLGDQKDTERNTPLSFRLELPGWGDLVVELQTNVIGERTVDVEVDQFWDRAEPMKGFQYVKELSGFDVFYLICLRGWRFNLDSLKHFINIMQMIHCLGEKIDYEELFALARSHKTYKRIVRTLSIVYREFPHLNLVNSLPRKKSLLFWDYQALLPGSQKKVKYYLDYIDYQYFSYDTIKHQFIGPKNQPVHHMEQTVPDN